MVSLPLWSFVEAPSNCLAGFNMFFNFSFWPRLWRFCMFIHHLWVNLYILTPPLCWCSVSYLRLPLTFTHSLTLNGSCGGHSFYFWCHLLFPLSWILGPGRLTDFLLAARNHVFQAWSSACVIGACPQPELWPFLPSVLGKLQKLLGGGGGSFW